MCDKQAALSRRDTGSTPRDLRRQAKIRQIVQAAITVFLEEGFTGASMDKIVAKAGVSKSTLYSYYNSKDEIFIDVMQMQLGSIYENFEPDRSKGEGLVEHLRHIGSEMLRIANDPATISLFRIIAAEAQRFPSLAHRFFEESFDQVISGIAAMMQLESSDARPSITEARKAGEYFVDLLFGTAQLRVIYGTTASMDERIIEERTERALSYFIATYQ